MDRRGKEERRWGEGKDSRGRVEKGRGEEEGRGAGVEEKRREGREGKRRAGEEDRSRGGQARDCEREGIKGWAEDRGRVRHRIRRNDRKEEEKKRGS